MSGAYPMKTRSTFVVADALILFLSLPPYIPC